MSPAFTYRIASACSQTWALMNGTEQVRHCGACNKNVFNFKEMTRTEIEVLLLKTEGRVCARLIQRSDGTVLTRDCPVALAKFRRKLVAGLMMATALVIGMYTALRPQKTCTSGVPVTAVKDRAVDLEDALRDTRIVGPIIEKLDPQHVEIKGQMALPPVIKGL